MKVILTTILMLFLSFPGTLLAETPETMARQAAQKYLDGQYQEALQLWQSLWDLGYRNGKLESNRADAFWKLGKVGEARRHLIQAQRLEPRNAQIRKNLNYVETKLKAVTATAWYKRIPFWRLQLNFDEALMLSSLGMALFFFILIRFYFKRKRVSPWLRFPLFFLLLFLLFQLAFSAKSLFWDSTAIVLTPASDLLSAPYEKSSVKLKLAEGQEVWILRSEGNFNFVKLNSGEQGWLAKTNLGEVF